MSSLADKHIFVTGIPGQLGLGVLAWLQKANPDARFSVLVAKDNKETVQKVLAGTIDKIWVGDIGQPYLGLAPKDYEALRMSVTHVYHTEALLDPAAERDDLYSVNVLGTENTAHMATQAPKLVLFVYVSTVYVHGIGSGEVISEDGLDENPQFRNYYEQSRCLAEQAVQSVRAKVPVVIVRPSILVSDGPLDPYGTHSTVRDWISLAKFAAALPGGGMLPADDTPCYAVSVDRLVEAVGRLSSDSRYYDSVYHVVDPRPQNGREVSAALYELVRGRPASRICPGWLLRVLLAVPWIRQRVGVGPQAAAYLRFNPAVSADRLRSALAGVDSQWPSINAYLTQVAESPNSEWSG